MDDYLDSLEIRDKSLRITKDLANLLKLGGLRHIKFVSIVPAIEENLNPSFDVTAKVKELAVGSDHLNSLVSGIKWNHGSDFHVVSHGINRELQYP